MLRHEAAKPSLPVNDETHSVEKRRDRLHAAPTCSRRERQCLFAIALLPEAFSTSRARPRTRASPPLGLKASTSASSRGRSLGSEKMTASAAWPSLPRRPSSSTSCSSDAGGENRTRERTSVFVTRRPYRSGTPSGSSSCETLLGEGALRGDQDRSVSSRVRGELKLLTRAHAGAQFLMIPVRGQTDGCRCKPCTESTSRGVAQNTSMGRGSLRTASMNAR